MVFIGLQINFEGIYCL